MILNKNKLNKRRFGKAKVAELISERAQLNRRLTDEFRALDDREIGQPSLYDLDGAILYVHGCKLIPGKGDLYSLEEINRVIDRYKRKKIRERKIMKYTGGDLLPTTWDVFSTAGAKMIENIPELIESLSEYLDCDRKELDKSYASLDLLSDQINKGDLFDEVIQHYDEIYVYIGEVFRVRSKGVWNLLPQSNIPYIDIGSPKVQYIPLNVMGDILGEMGNLDIRKLVFDEYKRHSARLKYETRNLRK